MTEPDPWWVKGILFENCNCQLLCPAHVSFKQDCDLDPCFGFWGIRIEKGRFGRLVLDPQTAVVLYQSPPKMHTPSSWRVQFLLDAGASEPQRAALEEILSGRVGGPWTVLAKFFAERAPSRAVPIAFEGGGHEKRMRVSIDGLLQSSLQGVESKRTGEPATLGNLFNVIHGAIQYLARGSSTTSVDSFRWSTDQKHSLYSDFSWTGP
jgi:hypothetical protein